MGVPAFFRWLSRKYPSIVVHCDDGVKGEYHFDNLYLDMNGIIHPCSHPENKPPPETEEDMFLAIFEYVEDILKIVKPKKLLYMAVDGVAPRAKMNQQRSRRFRAAQESYEKLIEIGKVKEALRDRGVDLKEKEKSAHFDSNVITPGTQFMINLSDALRTWINRKLSMEYNDIHDIWPKDLVVILSDASVPGEGEHKIMDYIRKQKASNNFNPNLSHCLYGADADLIMLGLATHEPNFTILREEFKPNQPRPCELCGQIGHELKNCTGQEKPLDEIPVPVDTDFIYIRLNVLREYLEKECKKCNVKLDFERFIDDYVFLCFFVGNDFLPHLPSLEIRENAIDRLIMIYKYVMENIPDKSDMYLTQNGNVNKHRVQFILNELGEAEDEIFKQRQRNEINFRNRNKRFKSITKSEEVKWLNPQAVTADKPAAFQNVKEEAKKMNKHMNNVFNERLKSMFIDNEEKNNATKQPNQTESQLLKQKRENSDSEPEDNVQLYNEGWKERYYLHKFGCDSVSQISKMVADEYFKGLCWVLLYYYQGCPDWKWFFPYHYAPFASDFKNVDQIEINFDSSAKPFKPLEQLMSVFPAASSKNLPLTWRDLMVNTNSPIIDFYPSTFKIDLNGKKAAWMGVALLPFIDEDRLFNALKSVYADLTEDEKSRNRLGTHLIFISKCHSLLSSQFSDIINSNTYEEKQIFFESNIAHLISGSLKKSSLFSDIYRNVFCCEYDDPKYENGFIFPAVLLPNAKIPSSVLKPEDLYKFENYRPIIGMNRRNNQAYLDAPGHRMVDRSMGRGYNHNSGRDRNAYYNNHQRQNNYFQAQRPYENNHQNDRRSHYYNNGQYYGQSQQYQRSSNSYQSNYGNSSYYQQSQNQTGYQQTYNRDHQYRSASYQHPPNQSSLNSRNNIPSYYTRDYLSHQQPNNNSRQSNNSQNSQHRHSNRYQY